MLREERAELVHAALASLSEEHRAILALREMKDLSMSRSRNSWTCRPALCGAGCTEHDCNYANN